MSITDQVQKHLQRIAALLQFLQSHTEVVHSLREKPGPTRLFSRHRTHGAPRQSRTSGTSLLEKMLSTNPRISDGILCSCHSLLMKATARRVQRVN